MLLNDQPLGHLVQDENDLVVYLPVAAGMLNDGENLLRIESPARRAAGSDDIRVGEILLDPRTLREALGEGTLEVDVVDVDTNSPLAARITIVDAKGSLHATANISNDHLAVREGVVYTSDGKARIGLPAGKYTIYAGRGFEYSLAKAEVVVSPADGARRTLAIRREVPTPGYIACDTHIHTRTHSGHGDATINERMITLAGEGIELPIATDHNLHIDYHSHAERLAVRQYFTPVIGNEVTTSVGHFNIFPIAAGSRVPDFKKQEWGAIFDEIFATPGVKIAILNHARDLHSNTRPFGPQLFNAASGENLDGWPLRFNAMEIINSGATQTDPLQLTRDWMALLNRGYQVTPVGSSDSHDVSRYIVGQGRTYIRCDETDVSKLDVNAAVESFLKGDVLVSYGLLVQATIGVQATGSEGVIRLNDDLDVVLQVLGPHWVSATRARLYANGQLVRDEPIDAASTKNLPAGIKWHGAWKIPRPLHDVHFIAVATGPGIAAPYWPTAKPYQPASPDWEPCVLAVSGASWWDGDGDGRRSSPREYAEKAFQTSGGDMTKLVASLTAYDSATSSQAAHLVRSSGQSLDAAEATRAWQAAAPQVRSGFQNYIDAWHENERARARR